MFLLTKYVSGTFTSFVLVGLSSSSISILHSFLVLILYILKLRIVFFPKESTPEKECRCNKNSNL